ncbi:hypothetical protein PFLUV_G00002980 [Perca fluviatilis]|uniref:Uncharacterized protein n=1 Tax=Perca fluviatilis TaxID=8168 RepID=A0A6A5FQQ1_PERFL|nr:hypothetical protein PFLUV_G00002980 [Perca fluviatilis]
MRSLHKTTTNFELASYTLIMALFKEKLDRAARQACLVLSGNDCKDLQRTCLQHEITKKIADSKKTSVLQRQFFCYFILLCPALVAPDCCGLQKRRELSFLPEHVHSISSLSRTFWDRLVGLLWTKYTRRYASKSK